MKLAVEVALEDLIATYCKVSGRRMGVVDGNFAFQDDEQVDFNKEFTNMMYKEIGYLYILATGSRQVAADLETLEVMSIAAAAATSGVDGEAASSGGNTSNDRSTSNDVNDSNASDDNDDDNTSDENYDKHFNKTQVDSIVSASDTLNNVSDGVEDEESDDDTIVSLSDSRLTTKTPATAKTSNKKRSFDDDVPKKHLSFEPVVSEDPDASCSYSKGKPTSPFDEEWLNKKHDQSQPALKNYTVLEEYQQEKSAIELDNMTRDILRKASLASKVIQKDLTPAEFISLVNLVIQKKPSDDDMESVVPDDASFLSYMECPGNQEGYAEYLAWQSQRPERELKRLQKNFGLIETATIKANTLWKVIHIIRAHIKSVGVQNVYNNDDDDEDTVISSLADGSTTSGAKFHCLVCNKEFAAGPLVIHCRDASLKSRDKEVLQCVKKRWKFWAVEFWQEFDQDPYQLPTFTSKKDQSQFTAMMDGVKKMDKYKLKDHVRNVPFFALFMKKFFMWNTKEEEAWELMKIMLTNEELYIIKEADENTRAHD